MKYTKKEKILLDYVYELLETSDKEVKDHLAIGFSKENAYCLEKIDDEWSFYQSTESGKNIIYENQDLLCALDVFLDRVVKEYNDEAIVRLKDSTEQMIDMHDKQRKINSYKNTDNYINWLENMVDKFECIYDDDDFERFQTEEDKTKSQDLGEFFTIIRNYADKNYIAGYTDPDNSFYNVSYVISHNDKNYEIGLVVGQGAYSYAKKAPDTQKAILFEDIKNDKLTLRAKNINEKLIDFEDYIMQLYDSSVPLTAISERSDSAIKKIRKRNINE